MNRIRTARPRRPALAAFLAAAVTIPLFLGASAAFAQGGSNAASGQCQRLQDTRYWRISHQIAPMPTPEDNATKRALDGFTLNTTQNADGTLSVNLQVNGRGGKTISVDPSSQLLYFLEGEMGDDSFGSDTDLGDEAVVLTDLQGCIQN
jgi:hypothetical protein